MESSPAPPDDAPPPPGHPLMAAIAKATVPCQVGIATAAMILGQVHDHNAAAAVVLEYLLQDGNAAAIGLAEPEDALALAAVALTRLAEMQRAVDFRV